MSPVAEQHIANEWEFARRQALAAVGTLLGQTAGDVQACLGLVDLVFVARISTHVVGCPKCGKRWVDGEVPEEVLRWALARIPAGRLVKIFDLELRARRSGTAA
jgi:hypothetical protein